MQHREFFLRAGLVRQLLALAPSSRSALLGGLLLCWTAAPALAQTYSVLHHFTGSGGATPRGGLVMSGARLYGTTCSGGSSSFGTVFGLNTDGSDFVVLKHFAGSDGANPYAGLTLAGTTLYGTTESGGSYSGEFIDKGTAFKLNTDGSGLTGLAVFFGIANPYAGLALSGTTLYGTTAGGGASGHSYGTVFSLNTSGGAAVLKSFVGSDGGGPQAGLALWGTTLFGTTTYGGTSNNGTVFSLNTDGSGFAVLKNFAGSDGHMPYAGLVLSGATLYGTTTYGGSSDNGTVFKLNTDGSGFAVLKDFASTDGKWPRADLVWSGATLYGTTWYGGGSDSGTVYKLNTDGSGFSVVKSFTGSDGANPYAGLLLSGATLFGTTESGGTSNRGVVFRLVLPIPPVITTPTLSQEIIVQGAASFSVVADGKPPLAYQWFFNGTNVLAGATNTLLRLTNVQLSQAGNYTVVITNMYGATTSSPAVLSVDPLLSTVTHCTETALRAALTTGDKVTFACDGTITLASTITCGADTILDGTGHQVTISGGAAVRVLYVNPGVTLTVDHLTIANGASTNGAGIFNDGGHVTLSGVVLQSNSAVSPYPYPYMPAVEGGGVFNANGMVNATNCTFAGNTAVQPVSTFDRAPRAPARGGALRNASGPVNLQNCTFSNNVASGSFGDANGAAGSDGVGGAIHNSGALTANACAFLENSATGGAAGNPTGPGFGGNLGGSASGGAIYSDGSLAINSSIFSRNNASGGNGGFGLSSGGGAGGSGNGGAVCSVGQMTVQGSVFVSNRVDSGSGGSAGGPSYTGGAGGAGSGGAIFIGGMASVASSTLAWNRAAGGAGGSGGAGITFMDIGTGGGPGGAGGNASGAALFNDGAVNLVNCTIAGNTASAASGGTGGQGGYGPDTGGTGGKGGNGGSGFGAICSTNGTVTMTNCTLASNLDQSGAGGLGGPGGSSYVHTGGVGPAGTNGFATGGVSTVGAILLNTLLAANTPTNCSGTITDAGHNLSSDASSAFTNAGSLNNSDPKLGPLADNGGSTRTMALLPGSPAIDAGDTTAAPATDQRGGFRPAGLAADIGAYEYGSLPMLHITAPTAGAVDILLREVVVPSCRLLTSTNLANWLPLATHQIGADGTALFHVPVGTGNAQRFYRVALP